MTALVQRLTPAERRQRNRQEMIQAILDVSREVMREEGVAALNLNEVARRLKMKTPSLYKYFSSKSMVYDELFRLAHRMFLEQVSKAVTDTANFWDTWTVVLRTQLSFAYSHPELFELGFLRPVPGFTPSEESLAISQVTAGRGEAIIRGAMESGEILTELSFAQVRDILFAITGGLTAAHMANEPNVPPEQGRFGSLAGHAMEIFKTAWGRHAHPSPAEQRQEGGR